MIGHRLAASALVATVAFIGSSSALLPNLTPSQQLSADNAKSSFKGYYQPTVDAKANLTRRQGPSRFTASGSTVDDGTCSDLELVYIRSGNEVGGTLGLLGMPLWNALAALKPNGLSAYNVNYDTSMSELFVTSTLGGLDATGHINAMAAKCPNQRYAVVGYSKGTIVAHQVQPDAKYRDRVIASVVIGDTLNRNLFLPPLVFKWQWPSASDRVISLCNKDDAICWPGGKNMEQHIWTAYNDQMPALAKSIIDNYHKYAPNSPP